MDRTYSSESRQLTLIGFGVSAIELINQIKHGPEADGALDTIAISDDPSQLDPSVADIRLALGSLNPIDFASILAKSQVTVSLVSNRDLGAAMASAEIARISRSIESVTIVVYMRDSSIEAQLPEALFSEFHARVHLPHQSSSPQTDLNESDTLYQQIEGGVVNIFKAMIANEYSFFTLHTLYTFLSGDDCHELICGSIRSLQRQEDLINLPLIKQARAQWSAHPLILLWMQMVADDCPGFGLVNDAVEVAESVTQDISDELHSIIGLNHRPLEVRESFDLNYLAMVKAT